MCSMCFDLLPDCGPLCQSVCLSVPFSATELLVRDFFLSAPASPHTPPASSGDIPLFYVDSTAQDELVSVALWSSLVFSPTVAASSNHK